MCNYGTGTWGHTQLWKKTIEMGDFDLKVWELVFYSLDSSSQCLLLLFLPCAAFPLVYLDEPYEIGTEF